MSDDDFSKLLKTIGHTQRTRNLNRSTHKHTYSRWLGGIWMANRDTGNGFRKLVIQLDEEAQARKSGGYLQTSFMVVSICQTLLDCPLLRNGARQIAPTDCEKFATPSTLPLALKKREASLQHKLSRNGKLTLIILITN